MENTEIKGIIFDYGGTIDSRGVHWSEVIWDGYRESGITVDKETFREAYVHAERGHIAADTVEPLAARVAQYCNAAARECIEEARPTLEALHARFPMILVSNFYGNVSAVLEDFDLLKYFNRIIESAVVGVRKPDPAIFALGVEALGLPAPNVLVIGDSYKKDILPTLSLGCHVAWLKGKGWTADEDAVTHPSAITRLSQVLDLVK